MLGTFDTNKEFYLIVGHLKVDYKWLLVEMAYKLRMDRFIFYWVDLLN